MSTLLSLSLALFAGLMMTRVIKRFKLPDVTAYLIAGVLVGPYFLGRLQIPGLGFGSFEHVERLGLISDAALGFIAFAIGNEFCMSQLRQTGKQATIVGIIQGIVAMTFVDIALIGLHYIIPDKLSLPAAITLGSIATATAPAATLMVVRQFKAKGKLTDILLPVVALDDAVGLATFSASFGIAMAMISGKVDLASVILTPIIEIVASLALGALMGWVLTQLERMFHSNSNRLSLIICFVLLTVALSKLEFQIGSVTLGFSSLLVCMMLGTIFCNLCPLSSDLMDRADRWTSPLYALFFVLSGAELELGVFSDLAIVGIGAVYIISRSLGKIVGAWSSTKATHCPPQVQKYLGITLLPQAGVALGMCVTAAELGADGQLVRNIVLFSVLIYELVGPMLTKWALTKAGDIQPIPPEVQNRRAAQLEQLQKPSKPTGTK